MPWVDALDGCLGNLPWAEPWVDDIRWLACWPACWLAILSFVVAVLGLIATEVVDLRRLYEISNVASLREVYFVAIATCQKDRPLLANNNEVTHFRFGVARACDS
jgi:hypothetical protein